MGIAALNIALTGIEASQVGVDTVAENLSNAETPGYISQTADLAALAGGRGPTGSGVDVQGVGLNYDPVLTVLAQSTSAQAGAAGSLAQAVSAAQSAFTDFPAASSTSSSASGTGLQSELSTFWSDWTAVANSPGSLAARTSLLGAAQALVDTLHSMSSVLSQAAQGTYDQLSGLVGQVDDQLRQVASLNEAILANSGSFDGGANGLVEQRQALANKLAHELGAASSTDAQGAMTVSVGGTVLVQNGTAASLAVNGSGSGTQVTANGTALSVSSGQAAGLLSAITADLPTWSASLDQVARALASTVDNQLGSGVYWTPLGSPSATSHPGIPMFGSSGGAITAAGIEINPTMASDPSTVAAGASSSSGPLDGSNAQAVANLASSSSGADSLYRALVGQVGSAVQAAGEAESVASQAAISAASQASAVEGVDSNVQLTTMIQYQQMFQAASKVIGTAASMLDSLLSAVP